MSILLAAFHSITDAKSSLIHETAEILDRRQIKHTNIKVVRFRWEIDQGVWERSPAAVWIRVEPGRYTDGDAPFQASQDILKMPKDKYDIDDLDVAFYEETGGSDIRYL